MKTETFFVPLIRGIFLEKARCPWMVVFSADGKGGESAELAISVEAGDEKAVGKKFALAFSESKFFKENKIPLRVKISSNGTDYIYHTAPCYSGIEKIRKGEQKEAWDLKNIAPVNTGDSKTPDYATSRSTVAKNRIALVTGGAQGFGEEITRGLVSAGALVFIADLNKEGAEKLAATLNSEYKKTVAFPAEVNVGDELSVQNMIENIAITAGGLDLCVSNAGVLRAASILEQDIQSFKFVTDINYVAFAIVTKHCGLLMKAQNATAPVWTTDIIQINSKSGLDGSNKNGSYAGSKFGGIGLVQSFAKELVEYNTKVNAVCPGNFFDGPLWSDPVKGLFVQYLNTGKVPGAKSIQDVKAFYEAKIPMGRGCTGPDVIRAVLYLVEQIYETGQALPVTGGQVMLS
ncbi:SDR family NAD(P)-dependent oxidoreductase [Leadbettera azotonutricia]|uniref:Short-chain dehydrogenase/reductase SDR n=1 Tax=Leadbettera azotonutricia (strain ATCC BAA-888 / DSM 13862 / ZAS-9) TaxID=545695 RepID=F5Y7T3_LEAAZ|nr:SDR family NAD(P)-dependent oxidoreductase [Leadbettera azotonutricia]AEF82330.1 short-chain dehydrogenase/reductase SDR [Leadbettera azotonutricia ZAS-9]